MPGSRLKPVATAASWVSIGLSGLSAAASFALDSLVQRGFSSTWVYAPQGKIPPYRDAVLLLLSAALLMTIASLALGRLERARGSDVRRSATRRARTLAACVLAIIAMWAPAQVIISYKQPTASVSLSDQEADCALLIAERPGFLKGTLKIFTSTDHLRYQIDPGSSLLSMGFLPIEQDELRIESDTSGGWVVTFRPDGSTYARVSVRCDEEPSSS